MVHPQSVNELVAQVPHGAGRVEVQRLGAAAAANVRRTAGDGLGK